MANAVLTFWLGLVALSSVPGSTLAGCETTHGRERTHTFTFRDLQDWQPVLDFLCVRRGTMVAPVMSVVPNALPHGQTV